MIRGVIAIRGIRLRGSGMVRESPYFILCCEDKRGLGDLLTKYDCVGIPKIMKSTRTIKTQVVESTDTSIVFKLQQEYMPKPMPIAKKVNSLVSLTLDEEGRVKYHKVRVLIIELYWCLACWLILLQDMWNEASRFSNVTNCLLRLDTDLVHHTALEGL